LKDTTAGSAMCRVPPWDGWPWKTAFETVTPVPTRAWASAAALEPGAVRSVVVMPFGTEATAAPAGGAGTFVATTVLARASTVTRVAEVIRCIRAPRGGGTGNSTARRRGR